LYPTNVEGLVSSVPKSSIWGGGSEQKRPQSETRTQSAKEAAVINGYTVSKSTRSAKEAAVSNGYTVSKNTQSEKEASVSNEYTVSDGYTVSDEYTVSTMCHRAHRI
jgi:hypothetical protein